MLFGNFISSLYNNWDGASRTLPYGLGYLWSAAKMKLGLGVAGITVSLMAATAQADCPDYTTYAQVNTPRWLKLDFLLISAEPSRESLLGSPGIALHAARPCVQDFQQYFSGGMTHFMLVGQRMTGELSAESYSRHEVASERS